MRIFVAPSELRTGPLVIKGDEHHYLARVRRAAVGERIELLDGEGHHAMALIEVVADDYTQVKVFYPTEIVRREPLIRALLPLIKGDRMDIALEKLVEVGVDEIVVWPAARSVVKLDPDKRDARIAKYRLAVQAAARQSGRAQIPTVEYADSLAKAAGLAPGTPSNDNASVVRFVLDPASELPLVEALRLAMIDLDDSIPHDDDEPPRPMVIEGIHRYDVVIVTGPEGGFSPEERTLLSAFTAVGLGQRVLRAETAPVAAVAILRAITRS